MKKTLILSLALWASLPALADLEGNGFYRVENMKTDRYAIVVDDKGSIDFAATNADLQAITLQRDFDAVSHNPGSVLYIEQVSDGYNISAQGTSVYGIINHYVHLSQNGTKNGQKVYMAYGVYDGVTRYLGDANNMGGDLGSMSITTTGDYRKWYIKPIKADGDNYLGTVPDVDAITGNYRGLFTTLYTSFPYSAYTEGVKFYTIDKYGPWGQVTLKEVKGVVPANTPVVVKCVGETSSDNRLNVGGSGDAVSFNDRMKGVFFNCDKGGKHDNRVKYDFDTMRVLGVCKDGSLGFIQYNVEYIPANTFYLLVPANSPSEYKIVTEEEFSKFDDTVVALDRTEMTLEEGESAKLTATVTSEYVSTDKQLTWSSSNENVASVKDGVVTAISVGTAQITVTLPNGNSATCAVTVKSKEPEVILVRELNITPASIKNYPGDKVQLTVTVLPENATDKSVEWSSSNEKVATVDGNGLVTITGVGTAVITVAAKDGSGVTATCQAEGLAILVTELQVTPTAIENHIGDEVQLTVTVLPENATDKSVEWISSDEKVATVNGNGLVTITGEGTATITVAAKDGSGVTGKCQVIDPEDILVTELILTPTSIENYPGDEVQLTVTVLPEDATNKEVEWKSSNKKVATVNESGLVTTVGEGTAIITVTAKDGSGVTAACQVDGLAGVESVLGEADKADVYTLNGLLLKENADKAYLSTLPKGIYILNISGKIYKVIN